MDKWTQNGSAHEYENLTIHMIIYRIAKKKWTFRTKYSVRYADGKRRSIATAAFFFKNFKSTKKYISVLTKSNFCIPMTVTENGESQLYFYRVTFDGSLELLTKQDFIDMAEEENESIIKMQNKD